MARVRVAGLRCNAPKGRRIGEAHDEVDAIQQETAMFKRIIICVAVAVVVAAAVFGGVVAWTERAEKIADPGYRLRGEGRRLAASLLSDENVKKAEQKFQEALEIFREANDKKAEASTLNDLGNLYSELHQYSKAIDNYNKSLEIKRKDNWAPLANLGDLYRIRHEYAKAAECYEQSIKAFEEDGDTRSAGILIHLANVHRETRQYPKAAECLEKSLEIARKSRDSKVEALALRNLGILYADQNQSSKATAEMPNLASINPDTDKGAQAYRVEREGRKLNRPDATDTDLRKAEKNFLESLAIFRSLKHEWGQAEVLTDLYTLYMHLDEFEKGLACNEESQEFKRKVRWASDDGNSLAHWGSYYWRGHDFAKAAEYYDRAVKAYEMAGDTEFAGLTLYDLGQAHRKLEQYSKAAECLERSLEITRKSGDVKAEVDTLVSLGSVHSSTENYAKAAEYYLIAIELSGNRGDSDLKEDVHKDLNKIYQRLSKTDPGSEQLKRVKLVLEKQWDKEALTQQLSDAIEAADIEKVKALLAKGADVNVQDRGGHLPLEAAAKKGSMELVRLLLDNGADPRAKSEAGNSALEAAFGEAMLFGHEEAARYFLDMGANVNAVDLKHGRTALAYAVNCSPDFVRTLLEKGADVNARCRNGDTVLMAAASRGRLETTRLLLDNGADVDAKNDNGQTALMEVARHLEHVQGTTWGDHFDNYLRVAKLLLERGADVNVKDGDKRTGGRTPLLRFSSACFSGAVKLLLEKGAEVNATLNDGSNALFWAMKGSMDVYGYPIRGVKELERRSRRVLDLCRTETARVLITHGIDVSAKLEADGSTALTWAAFLGDAELVGLLLDKGAEVDARLTDGRTPLMCAVTSGVRFEILKKLGARSEKQNAETEKGEASKFEILTKLGSWSEANARKQSGPALETSFDTRYIDIAKLLLDRKADVNAKLADGTTALMWASILGQTEMVKLLLERGADARAVLTDGSTALQWAVLYECREVVKLLTEKGGGGTLATAAMSGLTTEVQRLLNAGADVNAKDAHGTTALMECARGGYLETARLLLERGADARAKDERGWTALNEALWKGHLDVAGLLLDRGADPNAVDASGWTALIQAAWKGQLDVVGLLVAKGADIRAKDAFGKTAFMRAVEMGHRDIASLLLDKGDQVNAAEADGWTPVMAAVTRQDREMVKSLRERGARMTVAAAVLLGDEREMRRLVEEAARNRSHIADATVALLIATRAGREDMVTLLLDRCPDIDIKAPCSDTAFLFAIGKRYTGIAKALLKKGANVNAADDWRKTALHHAALVDDLSLVRMLVEKGADINARTVDNTAPLAYALGRNPNVKIVKFLLEKGASVNAADNFDFTAEVVRSGNKEVLELLKAHGLKLPSETKTPSEEDD